MDARARQGDLPALPGMAARMSADINHLLAVGRAATEGPWEWEADSCSDDGLTYTPSRVWTAGGVDYWGEANDDYALAYNIGNEDAEFIATARNEWDALLDEVERLREKVARIEALDFSARRLGMAFPDPWREGWNRALEVAQDDLRAALADESAQEALSREHFTCHRDGDTCAWEGCPNQHDDRACKGCFLIGAKGDTTGAETGARQKGGEG